MAFYVGQKVVCVKPCLLDDPLPHAQVGSIYTVANVFEAYSGAFNLELVELPFPETPDWYAGFVAEHFRPVVERKTDISIFKAMLNPSREEGSA